MDTKSLRPLLKLLREMGVTSYETPELKLQLEAVAPAADAAGAANGLPEERELTDEERMFYSAPAIPEVES